MEFFVIGLQPLQNLDRVGDARFGHVDLLEAADQRAVLLEILAIFLVGRRADAAQRAGLQSGLEQVRRVHRAAAGRARADDGVDFVDEEDRAFDGFEFLDDRFEAFLEIAAIARARDQRAHVERIDDAVLEELPALRS